MEHVINATALLVLLVSLAKLVAWYFTRFLTRSENNTAREYLENQLLAEAEALRAATRIRKANEAKEANLRG